MSVRHPEYVAPESVTSTNLTKETLTDSDGRFEWTDGTGDVLNIETITKEGYRISPKTGLNYGVASGSFENPVIFKMWKLGESQKLISHSLSRVGIPVDGQPVQFDLFGGLKVPSAGQLIIRFERDPQILSSGDSRYGWTAEIEIPNGGLIVSNDEFMYEAPESGYQEFFKVEMSKTADGWKSTLDQSFYIQLENGKYFGTLTVHLLTFHSPPPIVLNLDMTINPNGSRNLQP